MSKKTIILSLATAGSVMVLSCRHQAASVFESLSPSSTGVKFENKLESHALFNILYYLYYYNGGGVATGDINNDGLPDIYFTANSKGGNKLYLNKGNFKFEDVTDKAGVAGTADWCTGVTMADINGDGFLDIYVSAVTNKYGLKGRNELFMNNGNGSFTESAAKYGLDIACFTTQTAFFDYDHDGDLDCYVLNQSHRPHANISDTSLRRKYDSLSGDRLYRNDITTTGKFTDVSAAAGIYQSSLGYGLGISVADLNNDGWDDIYIGNDFHENDYYYVNNGNGTFSESGSTHFSHYSRFSMGNDAADYNNDGQMDIITVDMLPPDEETVKTYGSDENVDIYKLKLLSHGYQDQCSKNCLQRNNGMGASFSETSLISGVSATDWSWSPLFADFDNDGNKDLFVSSGIVKRPVDLDYVRFISDLKGKGMDKTDKWDAEAIADMPDGSSHPYFFKGNGQNDFIDVSTAWGTGSMKGYFNGAAYADLDNDGRLDMVINSIHAPASILKNNSARKDFLSIAFTGGAMNRFGLGAKAYVFTNGKMQYQELMLTRGFQSSSETRLHFGLDSTNIVDSVIIVWPNQKYQKLQSVAVNKMLLVRQEDAKDPFIYADHFKPAQRVFADPTPVTTWRHFENVFYDYNAQYLIPHEESTRGPKIAVGDVNKDGLDDFFVCGAKGQPGALMIQSSDGNFTSTNTEIFQKNAACEGVDAAFFDANNDGNLDLYVVSGGNEEKDGSPLLADHFYLNDGKGNFTDVSATLPGALVSKSCIAIADVDKDGDNDIFIGVLAASKKFGVPQTSWLLLNDGKGNFKAAAPTMISLDNIGMVTAARFTDIDNDGWTDLIVTGEWMAVKVYHNYNGKFLESDIPQSTGLWQAIYPADVNGDGLTDLLAGNWGHNSKLYAGKQGPLKLFVKDFDGNGSLEQVMTYSLNGKDYTFLAKDELERPLPVLKKAYLKYREVAGKTVNYIFDDLFKDYIELKAEVLGNSVFINDGKGGFTRTDLPEDLQMAPIMAFEVVNTGMKPGSTFLAGGNFFDVIPYEGRYDAQPLALFNCEKGGKIASWYQPGLPDMRGQVRDIKWLHTKNGEGALVARNDNGLLFYKLNK